MQKSNNEDNPKKLKKIEGDPTTVEDTIDTLMKKQPKVLRGFVLDQDISEVINRLSQSKGKGFKSAFVNASLRKILHDRNLL